MSRTELSDSGQGCYRRVKRMLDAADIDPDTVRSISIVVEHGDDADERMMPEPAEDPWSPPDGEAGGEDPDSDGPEEERGPTEPGEALHHKGGGGTYEGDYPVEMFDGEAIAPDSIQGRVLGLLADNPDRWFDRHQAAEALDLEATAAGDALSNLFNNKGWAKRRRVDPQPNKRGVQREYASTQSGRSAISEGRRRAKEYQDERRETQEEEMDG